jgi:hypothetical protein
VSTLSGGTRIREWLVLTTIARLLVATGVIVCLSLSACDGGGTSKVPPPNPSQLGLRSPPPKLVNACHDLATKKQTAATPGATVGPLPADTALALVYCPPAIPRGDLTLGSVGPFGRGDTHTYYISALSPSLPHPYIKRARKKGEDYPPAGHWVVSATRPPSDQRSFLREEGAHRVGRENVNGVSATVLLVPSGAAAEDSGHAVVYWQFHGVGYTASVHGYTNRGVAEAMARALISEMLRCPSTAGSDSGCQLVIPTSAR